jgi:hypothetical protein
MSLFLLIIIYKLLINVREVKTRFKLIKHIDTKKKVLTSKIRIFLFPAKMTEDSSLPNPNS